MNEDFVTYEQAQNLCDLGFDFKCICCYDEKEFDITYANSNYNSPYYRDNLVSAPTLAQVQKWLYEKHNLWVTAELTESAAGFYFDWCIAEINKNNHLEINMSCVFNGSESYFKDSSECLSAGINQALELLKEKNND